METKTAPLLEIKTNSTPGEFTAVISAIGNVDRERDRVMPHAFKAAMEEDPIPPVCWAHQHEIPPCGEGLEWMEKGSEVWYTGRLFVKGDTEHPYANMVYAGLQSYDGRPSAINQFSYTYGVPEGGAERVLEDGKAIRNLHQIRPVIEVGPCWMGMNSATRTVTPAKAHGFTKEEAEAIAAGAEFDFFQLGLKAEWSQSYLDSLPDTAFLYVEPGGKKDATGRTDPRELRHFPYKDVTGAMDMPHLRTAIENAPQTSLSEEIRGRVETRAKRLLQAQEGKALLLGTIHSSKAWDDIEGYPIYLILGMLDNAVSYIQSEYEADDVAQMQVIAANLIALMQRDFGESSRPKSATKAAFEMAVGMYEQAAEVQADMSSEAARTLSPEYARLLLVRPTH